MSSPGRMTQENLEFQNHLGNRVRQVSKNNNNKRRKEKKKQQSSLKIRATTERDPHITIVNDTRGSSLKHEKYGAILKPQSLQTSLHSGKNSGIIV